MRLLCLIALLPALAFAEPPPAIKDGNRVFARSLLSTMNAPEYASYLRHFVKVMDRGEVGATYAWKTRLSHGRILAGQPFLTKTKQHCRPFSESYAVGKDAQTFKGIACKNKRGGWCKLRKGSTYNCALLRPGGLDGFLLDTSIALDSMSIGLTRMKHNFNSFTSSLPF